MSENISDIREGLEKQLKDGFAGLQKKYDAASEEIQKGNQVTTDLKKQIQTATDDIQKVVDKVLKLEEKGIGLGNQPGTKKGFIDFIKGNDEYKALQGREKSAAEIEIKKDDLASMQETKAVTSAGIVVPNYDPTIQPGIPPGTAHPRHDPVDLRHRPELHLLPREAAHPRRWPGRRRRDQAAEQRHLRAEDRPGEEAGGLDSGH